MAALTRIDGWASALTTLGTKWDKFKSYAFLRPPLLSPVQCSDLYHFNPLAKKICDLFPEDAHREGICVKDDAGEELDDVKARLTELDAVAAMTLAAVWGNAFGWGAVYLGVQDGQTQDQPLDPKRVTKVEFLRVVDLRDVSVAEWYGDPLSRKFNTPSHYTFAEPGTTGAQPVTGVKIHESRFVQFHGARTAMRERRANNGFCHSKLQAVNDQLLRVGVSWDNAAQLLQTVSQVVMKIKGLQAALVSDKGAEALERRAQAVDAARSITKSVWIDADGEEVMQLNTSLTGVSDVLDRLGAMLSACTGIPVTKLFGTQPTGLQATGAADERSWNNRVESYRKQELAPGWDVLVSCLSNELHLTTDVVVSFPSLDRPTDAETADIRLKVAQADQIYIANQVVLPEEVAVSRFGGPAWSMDTQLKPGPRDELEFPSDQQHSQQLELMQAKGGAAQGSDEREDTFDPDQPRDETGRWTAAGAAARAKGEHSAAWSRYQRERTPENKAELDKALAKLKQRKALARKVGDEERENLTVARPSMSAEQRKAYIEPHRAELKAAQAAHAADPSLETAERLALAQDRLRAARATANSTAGAEYKAPRAIVHEHVASFEQLYSPEKLQADLQQAYEVGRKEAAQGARGYKAETVADAHEYAIEHALEYHTLEIDVEQLHEKIVSDFEQFTNTSDGDRAARAFKPVIRERVQAAKANLRAAKSAFKKAMKAHPDRKNKSPVA